jgi:hypothetical protein
VQHERTGLLLQHRPNRLDTVEESWEQQFSPGGSRFQILSRQYAALLQRLITNAALRRTMAERASASAPVGRSWEASMGCMVEYYEEAAAARRKHSDAAVSPDEVIERSSRPQSRIFMYPVGIVFCLSVILYLLRPF